MNDISRFENERAENYDDLIKVAIPTYEYLMKTMPVYLGQNLSKTSPIELLIAGCGTGNEALCFLEDEKNWKITGVDPSPDMVGIARKKLRGYNDCRLMVGQVKGLPEGHKFDAATLSLVLHFLKDNGPKQLLLNDISARLKKGAPFLIMDMFGDKDEIRTKLSMLASTLPSSFSSQEIKERSQRILEEINYVKEDRFRDLLKHAGFSEPLRYHQTLMYGAWLCYKL